MNNNHKLLNLTHQVHNFATNARTTIRVEIYKDEAEKQWEAKLE